MIQDYEQEYGEMTAELLCLLRKFLQSDPDERSNSIKEIKEKIEACQELLEQMTIESYQHTNTDIRLSQHARIRSYRTDLERFEEEFKRAKDSFNNTPKTFLDDSEVGIDYSQREKLLNNTERLERTGNIMQDGYRTLIETEQIGVHVMANLLGQRETIRTSQNRLRETESVLSRSSRIVNNIINRSARDNIFLYIFAAVFVLVIVVTLYFSLSSK